MDKNSLSFSESFSNTVKKVEESIKPGSVNGSVICLVTCVVGAGTTTLPYLAAKNGIILGCLYVAFGASISYYCGMLLTRCAERTGSDKYEDLARHCYGHTMTHVVGWCNLVTLLGFVVAYIVVVKNLIPQTIMSFIGTSQDMEGSAIYQFATSSLFWATFFTGAVVFPLSIPRTFGSLRLTSLLGILCTVYIVAVLIALFFFKKELVPNKWEHIVNAKYFDFTLDGFIDAMPFVIFAYMYQPAIPIIYRELEHKNYSTMSKVVIRCSYGTTILYFFALTFGYLSLVGWEDDIKVLHEKRNILEINYNSLAFKIGVICLLVTIFVATPLCVLPAKDTFEEMVLGKAKLSTTANVLVTAFFCVVTYLPAITISNIGDAIAILGCTTNPLIGFILPCVFYLELIRDAPTHKIIFCILTLVFIICMSIVNLITFIKDKLADQ